MSHASHVVPGLSFPPEQVERRRHTLGASEIGIVAGLNPYRSPFDLWLEKTGQVPSFAGNEFTKWGLRMEQPIADEYADCTGTQLEKSETIIDLRHPWMSCTPDRFVVGEEGERIRGVEIKRFGQHREDEFGPAGTDQVPHEVAAQCQWSMLITGVYRWDVAVLLGQADFRIYHLTFDIDIATGLFSLGHDFWHNSVLVNRPPLVKAGSATARFLQQAFPTHDVELLEPTEEQVEIARSLAYIRRDMKALEQQQEDLESQLKLAIGPHAGLHGVCTWKAPKSGPIHWKDVADTIAKRYGVPRELFDEAVRQHTGEPSRRFSLTLKEG